MPNQRMTCMLNGAKIDLTKAGLKARERHIANCTSPFVDPKAEGLGAFSLASIILILTDKIEPRVTEKGRIDAYEYARHPILDNPRVMAIPTQSIELDFGSIPPVVLSMPLRAIRLRMGSAIKVKGHKDMQKLYILAILKVRSRVGMKIICMPAEMPPETARE